MSLPAWMTPEPEPSAIIRNCSIEAPRWAGVTEFLHDAASGTGVTFTHFTIDKGWVFTTVYFGVEGPKSKVEAFQRVMRDAIDRYGRD